MEKFYGKIMEKFYYSKGKYLEVFEKGILKLSF
jgi:hypothetical protein